MENQNKIHSALVQVCDYILSLVTQVYSVRHQTYFFVIKKFPFVSVTGREIHLSEVHPDHTAGGDIDVGEQSESTGEACTGRSGCAVS